MREIKFRGRDGDDWYYGSLFVNECGHTVISAPKSFWMKPVNADTVGQFTGLKDLNGKEIYEGDIIASQSDLIPIFELKSPDYVVFHDGAFWLSDSWNRHNCKGTLLAIASVHNEIARCKVIGNIYDNPELLEVEA